MTRTVSKCLEFTSFGEAVIFSVKDRSEKSRVYLIVYIIVEVNEFYKCIYLLSGTKLSNARINIPMLMLNMRSNSCEIRNIQI